MDLESLKRKQKTLLRQWHVAEEAYQWQEADRLLVQAEVLGEKIERMQSSQSQA